MSVFVYIRTLFYPLDKYHFCESCCIIFCCPHGSTICFSSEARFSVKKMQCMFWFSPELLSEPFPVLRIIQPDIIVNSHRQSNLNFWTVFRKNQISNFMKILPVGAKVFLAERDRQTERETDMAKLIVFFAILRTRPEWATLGAFLKSWDINCTKPNERI